MKCSIAALARVAPAVTALAVPAETPLNRDILRALDEESVER